MKTLTKTFARRVISALLVTIMVFSLGITSIVSTSAANVEFAETSYSNSSSFYCMNSFLQGSTVSNWTAENKVKMSGSSGVWTITLSSVPTTDTVKFFLHAGENGDYIFPSGNANKTVNPDYGNNYRLNNGDYQISSTKPSYYWNVPLTGHTNYSHVDVKIEFNQTESQPFIKVYVLNGTKVTPTVTISSHSVTPTSVGEGNSVTLSATVTKKDSTNTPTIKFEVRKSGGTYTTVGTTKSGLSHSVTYIPTEEGTYEYKVTATLTGATTQTKTGSFTVTSLAAPSVTVGEMTGVTVDGTQNKVVADTEFSIQLTPTHTDSTITGYQYKNENDEWVDVAKGSSFTFTDKAPSQVDTTASASCVIRAVKNGAYSEEYTYTFNYVTIPPSLTATVNLSSESGFLGETFDVTVNDNSIVFVNYGAPVYTLYKADNTQIGDPQLFNVFEIKPETLGANDYYIVVEIEDYSEYTARVDFTITTTEFTADDFKYTVEYDNEVEVNERIKINIATDVKLPLKYSLTFEDGTTLTSDNGKFDFTATEEYKDTTIVLILTAEADCNGEWVTSSKVETLQVKVNPISDFKNVTIYFKATDTLNYRPVLKVKTPGMDETTITMEKTNALVPLTHNHSGAAHYWWYKAEVVTSSANPEIIMNLTLGSAYALEVNYTFEAEYDVHYFIADNLNCNSIKDKVTGEVIEYPFMDVTEWSEAKRNWTQSAVHMLYDDRVAFDGPWVEPTPDFSPAPVGYNYRSVSLGDANDDGKLNVRDATTIQKSLAKTTELSEVGELVADFNGDGKITVKDATAVQKQLAGL